MTSDVGCGGCEMQIKPDVSGQHSNAAAHIYQFSFLWINPFTLSLMTSGWSKVCRRWMIFMLIYSDVSSSPGPVNLHQARRATSILVLLIRGERGGSYPCGLCRSVKHFTKVSHSHYRVASNNKIARFYFILLRFQSPSTRDKKTMQWMQIHTFKILFGEQKYWIQ